METEIKDNLLVLAGKVEDRTENLLNDTDWSGVIAKKSLVGETNMTGDMGHMMMVDQMIKRAPIAKINGDTL